MAEIASNPSRVSRKTRLGLTLFWLLFSAVTWCPIAFFCNFGGAVALDSRVSAANDYMLESLRLKMSVIQTIDTTEKKFAMLWSAIRHDLGNLESPSLWQTKANQRLMETGISNPLLCVWENTTRNISANDSTHGLAELFPYLISGEQRKMASETKWIGWGKNERMIPIARLFQVRKEHYFYQIPLALSDILISFGKINTNGGSFVYLLIFEKGEWNEEKIDEFWIILLKTRIEMFSHRECRIERLKAVSSQIEPLNNYSFERIRQFGLFGETTLKVSSRDRLGNVVISKTLPIEISLWGFLTALACFFLSFAWLLGSYRFIVLGDSFWLSRIKRKIGFHLLLAVGLPIFGVLIIGEMDISELSSNLLVTEFKGLEMECQKIDETFAGSVLETQKKCRDLIKDSKLFSNASEAINWGIDSIECKQGVPRVFIVSSQGAILLPWHEALRPVFISMAGQSQLKKQRFLRKLFEESSNTGKFYLDLIKMKFPAEKSKFSQEVIKFLAIEHRKVPLSSRNKLMEKALSVVGKQVCQEQGGKIQTEKISPAAFASTWGGLDQEDFIAQITKNLGKLKKFSTEKNSTLEMIDLVRDKNGVAQYFILLNWREDDFTFPVIIKLLDENRPKRSKIAFFAFSQGDETVDFSTIKLPRFLKPIAFNLEKPGEFVKLIAPMPNGQQHLVFLQRSKEMPHLVLGRSVPFDGLAKQISDSRKNFGFAILGLGITIAYFSWALRKFLLEPIVCLQNVVAWLSTPSSEMIPVRNAIGELASLSKLFETVGTGLRELDLAHIMQDELFPKGELQFGKVKISGKSTMMEQVGGDYFDFIPHPYDPNSVFVCLGDVAGHGLQAAIVGVMATTGFRIFMRFGETDPVKLLTNLNLCFVNFLKRIRMMTCQIIQINGLTGEFKIANAGHTPFIKVAPNGTSEGVMLPAMPLGLNKMARFAASEGMLQSEGGLVLYTDGAVEAMDVHGAVIGYPKFLQIATKQFQQGFDGFISRMFDQLETLTGGRNWDDDVTFIVIRSPSDNSDLPT